MHKIFIRPISNFSYNSEELASRVIISLSVIKQFISILYEVVLYERSNLNNFNVCNIINIDMLINILSIYQLSLVSCDMMAWTTRKFIMPINNILLSLSLLKRLILKSPSIRVLYIVDFVHEVVFNLQLSVAVYYVCVLMYFLYKQSHNWNEHFHTYIFFLVINWLFLYTIGFVIYTKIVQFNHNSKRIQCCPLFEEMVTDHKGTGLPVCTELVYKIPAFQNNL